MSRVLSIDQHSNYEADESREQVDLSERNHGAPPVTPLASNNIRLLLWKLELSDMYATTGVTTWHLASKFENILSFVVGIKAIPILSSER